MDVGIIHRDERSAAFFDAAAQETLLIKRCGGCDAWLGPEAGGCPGCGAVGAGGLIWAPASGQGILISWAVVRPPLATPRAAVPAVLALVELDEGPWLHTLLETGDPSLLKAGVPVQAHFAHPEVGESFPFFRLSSGPAEPGNRQDRATRRGDYDAV